MVLAGLVGSSLLFRPTEREGSRLNAAPIVTVLPGRVEPVQSFYVNSPFGGKIADVLVNAGADVRPGQKLIEITSEEAMSELQRARARVKVAEARLRAARAGARPNQTKILKEQHETAQNSWKAHRERLESYSTTEAERAYADAKARLLEARQLFDKQLASRAELDDCQARERAELRNLAAAQEHRSRLKQEVDAAASQVRLTEMQMN
jgi:multidrug efflux pump subunit AcrA (membrane-fusion protein)